MGKHSLKFFHFCSQPPTYPEYPEHCSNGDIRQSFTKIRFVVSLEATKKFVVKYNSFTGVKFERVSTDNATGKWFDNISVTVIIPCFNLVFTRDPLCAAKIITEAPPNVRIIGKCCVVRHASAYYGRASKDLITDRHLSDVEDTWQHISVYQIK